jgi:hypothetical protein
MSKIFLTPFLPLGMTEFRDSGFKSEFQDSDSPNQVQHFSAGAQAGYQYETAANLLHRIIRPDTPPDTALNDKSTSFGRALSQGELDLSQVRDWILTNICGKNSGTSAGSGNTEGE